jgi:hypothetical protein
MVLGGGEKRGPAGLSAPGSQGPPARPAASLCLLPHLPSSSSSASNPAEPSWPSAAKIPCTRQAGKHARISGRWCGHGPHLTTAPPKQQQQVHTATAPCSRTCRSDGSDGARAPSSASARPGVPLPKRPGGPALRDAKGDDIFSGGASVAPGGGLPPRSPGAVQGPGIWKPSCGARVRHVGRADAAGAHTTEGSGGVELAELPQAAAPAHLVHGPLCCVGCAARVPAARCAACLPSRAGAGHCQCWVVTDRVRHEVRDQRIAGAVAAPRVDGYVVAAALSQARVRRRPLRTGRAGGRSASQGMLRRRVAVGVPRHRRTAAGWAGGAGWSGAAHRVSSRRLAAEGRPRQLGCLDQAGARRGRQCVEQVDRVLGGGTGAGATVTGAAGRGALLCFPGWRIGITCGTQCALPQALPASAECHAARGRTLSDGHCIPGGRPGKSVCGAGASPSRLRFCWPLPLLLAAPGPASLRRPARRDGGLDEAAGTAADCARGSPAGASLSTTAHPGSRTARPPRSPGPLAPSCASPTRSPFHPTSRRCARTASYWSSWSGGLSSNHCSSTLPRRYLFDSWPAANARAGADDASRQ